MNLKCEKTDMFLFDSYLYLFYFIFIFIFIQFLFLYLYLFIVLIKKIYFSLISQIKINKIILKN